MTPERQDGEETGAAARQSAVNELIDQLSQLLRELLMASRATSEPVQLMKINSEYSAVRTCLDQAVQSQGAANDATFQQAIVVLKRQASVLEGMEKEICKIVSNAALAGRIAGYLAEAITLLAKL